MVPPPLLPLVLQTLTVQPQVLRMQGVVIQTGLRQEQLHRMKTRPQQEQELRILQPREQRHRKKGAPQQQELQTPRQVLHRTLLVLPHRTLLVLPLPLVLQTLTVPQVLRMQGLVIQTGQGQEHRLRRMKTGSQQEQELRILQPREQRHRKQRVSQQEQQLQTPARVLHQTLLVRAPRTYRRPEEHRMQASGCRMQEQQEPAAV
jgi:hypothetical protein